VVLVVIDKMLRNGFRCLPGPKGLSREQTLGVLNSALANPLIIAEHPDRCLLRQVPRQNLGSVRKTAGEVCDHVESVAQCQGGKPTELRVDRP
jgi:hypothetical protein